MTLSTSPILQVFPLSRLVNVKIHLEAVVSKLCKVKELFIEVLLRCSLTLRGGPGELPFENLELGNELPIQLHHVLDPAHSLPLGTFFNLK